MQLIERYLTEVEAHLPKTQRDDIVVELRDDLVEQVQARADSADRKPTLADESAVLESLGHPLKLASSYKSRRYLIGPELYPAYLQALKVALCSVFAVIVFASLVFGSADTWGLVVKGLLNSFFEVGLWVAGIVTLSFLALESSGSGVEWYDDWKPEDLKLGSRPLDYSAVVSNLVSEGLFLLWWNGLILGGWDAAEGADLSVNLSVIWHELFWPLNVLFGASFLVHVVVLARSAWTRWLSMAELVLCALLLITIGVLLGNQPLVVSNPELAIVPWIDRTLVMSLLVIAGFTVWDGVLAYRRLR